jgi:transglutaminase-like putative cysteine protease
MTHYWQLYLNVHILFIFAAFFYPDDKTQANSITGYSQISSASMHGCWSSRGKRDPKIRDLAVAVTRSCRSKEYACEARALHDYVRENVRYVKDTASVERLATSQRTLFMENAGDCDDSSIALSALLESIGHETRLILIDPVLSGKFTHVISQVRIGDTWYWMETTRKVLFNWLPGLPYPISLTKNSQFRRYWNIGYSF